MGTFGEIGLVGVEGTGSYGAGLARHLHREGLVVVEVDRPNRQERARQGKSDSLDAIEAARAALSGRAFGVAKTRDGNVEAIRALMVARRSARESRTKAVNQIRQLVYTAPDELRERFVGVPSWRIAEGVAILRVHADADPVRMATKSALGTLGRRAVALGEEGKRLDVLIARLVDKVAPELVELVGLGPDTAALSSSRRATTLHDCAARPPGPSSAAWHRSKLPRARSPVIVSTAAVTDRPTTPCGALS